MAIELTDFYKEFFQDLTAVADADGRFAEDAFFSLFCDQLVEAGELDTADRTHYISPNRATRVDGYGGDPATAEGVLSLIIADFHQSPEIATLTATEMEAIFKRLYSFLSRSLDKNFRNALEETGPAFGLADMIAARWASVSKVRLFLISNRMLSTRVDGRDADKLGETPVTYSVWDIGRLYRFAASSLGREDIEIDLEKDFGGPLYALPAHLKDAGYESYLVAVPGLQLAKIYDRWGARLLEQNVRVFLQAKGNVNKGIRNTIETSPEMFFAYNNGVTATAEGVETRESENGLLLTSFKNLQIVNGGQTTASIHAASRKKEIDLSRVFVQMKLSIVDRAKSMEVVPKISEYANSQNRVNAADFFANHPFHIRMEGFSRRLFAPSPDGTFRESKWFYERARGQYQDERSKLSPAQLRKFDLEYPKAQLFTKTDLGKFLMVWWCHPEIVSKGAQKNFAAFAQIIGKDWSKNEDTFNERYYRHCVAKGIAFIAVEELVTEQPWYQGGYRANVVAYAISKLAHDAEKMGLSVDFDAIWKAQALSPVLIEALKISAEACHNVIVDTPANVSNVTEWAKHQACWNRVASLEIRWPTKLRSELVGKDEVRDEKKAAQKAQKVLNGISAQTIVVNAGSTFWQQALDWGISRKLLTPIEQGVLETASAMPRKLPSDKQSNIAVSVLKKLHGEGYQAGKELV